jgi:hypothetical protein
VLAPFYGPEWVMVVYLFAGTPAKALGIVGSGEGTGMLKTPTS